MPIDDWPPDPIIPNPALRVEETLPGSKGGMIEAVKTAIIVALRDAMTGSTLNNLVSGSDITVSMEYPMVPEAYPGIWVQFSFSKIQNAGIHHEMLQRTVEGEGTPEEWVNWEPIREFIFEGRATMTIVALTSLERDRIADAVITMLAFSRPPESVITRADRDTRQFRQLIDSLAHNPYISITLNHDVLYPGGQTMTIGVPWDREGFGYEDSYGFDLQGQCNILFKNDGTFSLHAIRMTPELVRPSPYEWQ